MAAPAPAARGIGTVRYPRLAPRDEACAKQLAKRTLTNLYNERPTWLDLAHRRLDEALFAAYGWPSELCDDDLNKVWQYNRDAPSSVHMYHTHVKSVFEQSRRDGCISAFVGSKQRARTSIGDSQRFRLRWRSLAGAMACSLSWRIRHGSGAR